MLRRATTTTTTKLCNVNCDSDEYCGGKCLMAKRWNTEFNLVDVTGNCSAFSVLRNALVLVPYFLLISFYSFCKSNRGLALGVLFPVLFQDVRTSVVTWIIFIWRDSFYRGFWFMIVILINKAQNVMENIPNTLEEIIIKAPEIQG